MGFRGEGCVVQGCRAWGLGFRGSGGERGWGAGVRGEGSGVQG